MSLFKLADLSQRLPLCIVALVSLCALPAAAQNKPPQWVSDGPYVTEAEFSLELPLTVQATKLYVEVEIAGTPRRFVFDTGSPSMISAALAAELELPVVGKSQGRDAHGAVVASEIVQADLKLGGTVFNKVPLYAADFSQSAAAQCLIGDGVLGSEILPLCAWQIDLPNSVLRCSTELARLNHVEGAEKLRLHDFGYPHAPIFDVRFANKAASKAMFDTGSPAYFAIATADYEGAKRARGIGKIVTGYGSAGASLGGQAADREQLQAELKSLSIDRLKLGRVAAIMRHSPPSLIGASMLEHYVVTLDSRSQAAYFDRYRKAPYGRSAFGFHLAFADPISVSLVWEDSPAQEAGLSAGMVLTKINGVVTSGSCVGIGFALDAMGGERIELEWDSGSAVLNRGSQLLN